MGKLRELFFKNLGLKVLALIIAVVLWLLAKGYLVKLF